MTRSSKYYKHKTLSYLKIKDRTLTDMKAFHSAVDWSEWWTQFSTALNKNGGYKYPILSEFVKVKKKNLMQQQFLSYYLGHKQQEVEQRFSFVEPQAWVEKRKSGGWFTQESVAKFAKGVRAKFNALDAIREAGDGVIFSYLTRINNLANALDEAFHGQLYVEDLSLKENVERNEVYFAMHTKLLSMLDHAFHLYAKSTGINFSDMDGFAVLLKAQLEQNNRINGPDVTKTGTENFLSKLVQMSMEKASQYKLPLPKDAEEIIDTTVATETQHHKKNKVQ